MQRRSVEPLSSADDAPVAVRRDVTAASDRNESLEQFTTAFAPPAGVKAAVTNGSLVLSGSAPYEWIKPVREGATKIAGITAINGDDLVVQFDPKLVLERFREEFGIPDGVDASVQKGRLILSGRAPHVWLDRVRRGGMRVPGVHLLDDRKVEDIDQLTFHEAKAAIDDAAVLFVLNRDTIPPEAGAALRRVAEETRRCLTAAQNMGVSECRASRVWRCGGHRTREPGAERAAERSGPERARGQRSGGGEAKPFRHGHATAAGARREAKRGEVRPPRFLPGRDPAVGAGFLPNE